MKYIRIIFIICLFVLINCKDNSFNISKYNLCEENKHFIEKLYQRDNALFPYFTNYGNLDPSGNYYFFKKYNLVNGLFFELTFSDTCSQEMNKKMLIKKGYDYTEIKWKLDSFQYSKRNVYDRKLTHCDGVLMSYGQIKHPINKNENFEKELLEKILIIDSAFIASGFWIIVDENGKVSDIESYIRHSKEVESIISEKLLQSD